MTGLVDLRRRLAALEALPRREELQDVPEGMQRIAHGLYVPLPMPRAVWELLAAAQQAKLARNGAND